MQTTNQQDMLSKQTRGCSWQLVDLFPGLPPDQPGVLVQPDCNEGHALREERSTDSSEFPWHFWDFVCLGVLELQSVHSCWKWTLNDSNWFWYLSTDILCCFHWRCWGAQFCFGFGFSIGSPNHSAASFGHHHVSIHPQCAPVWLAMKPEV